MTNKNPIRYAAVFFLTLGSASVHAQLPWSEETHQLAFGDFNDDGKTDVLYIARDPGQSSGIALANEGGPYTISQTWPSNDKGIAWHSGVYKPIVADFTGEGRADIFLQRQTPGDHYLLHTDAQGQIPAINQTLPNYHGEQLWSADKHRIVAGDFDGDGKADLFLQSVQPSGSNAVFLASETGTFGVAKQTWGNYKFGFNWSLHNAVVHAGDFDGDHKDDLFVQAKPDIVIIDYEIPFPVPVYRSGTFGVMNAKAVNAYNEIFYMPALQIWDRNHLGADWSAAVNDAVVGDFNGDGRADIFLQRKNAGVQNSLFQSNGGGQFHAASVLTDSSLLNASGDQYRIFAANFDGTPGSSLYLQSKTSAGAVSAFLSPSSQVSPPVIGRTAGQFNVSQAGTAEYHVPLWTPPAAGGMRPELAVSYSHVRENGLLGMGFEISGFSAITRCPKTIAQDGADGPIKLDGSDAFCLDGNRLRRETGIYGVAGSTYRTEIESFSKIVASGSAGTGPASFEVWKRDGRIYEYGMTADSRIDFGADTPRAWALNAIRDRAGNRIEFTYHEDASGTPRPNTINYATNAAAGVSAAPYQVLFVYEPNTRPDPVLGFYPAGGPESLFDRLQRVEIRYGGSPIKLYKFAYEPAGGAGSRSRLASLQECSTSESICLSPTLFTWTNGSASLQAEQSTSLTIPAALFLADVDGDGRDDLVYPSHVTAGQGTWRIRKANSSGTYDSEINTGISNAGYSTAMPFEWDGDGMTDILVPYATNQWHVLRSTGAGFATPWNTGIAVSGNQFVADFNGDGRDDLVRVTTSGAGAMYVRYRGASNFGAETQLWTTGDPNFRFASFSPEYRYRSRIREADFNGDSIEDFLCWMDYYDPESQQTANYVARCFASGFEVVNTSVANATDLGGNYTFADFNDDGLTDVLWTYFSGGTGILYGGSMSPTPGPQIANMHQFVVMDYDGDGRDDLLVEAGGSVPLKYYRSTGSGLASPVDTPYTYPAFTPLMVAEVNGDLYRDLVSGGTIKYRLHDPNPSDLLQTATDGFGVSAAFSYTQMTDATVYTKGSGAVYPKMDFKSARPLVKQVTATDGSGTNATYTLTYTYEAARRNLNGRGFLGFAKRNVVDSRLGYNLKTEQSYLQDWPYTGMLSLETVKQANGNIVSESTNLWNVLVYSPANQERQYPYVYSTSTQERELNNVAFRTTTRVLAGSLGAGGIDSVSGIATDVTTTTTENGSTGLYSNESKTERTVNTVFNSAENWCLGRPDRTTWENDLSLTGINASSRVLDREWNGAYCRLDSEVVEPDLTTWTATTAYLYDDFGNVRRETVTGANMDPRATNIGWGTAGRFPVTVTNALTQTTTIGYDYALGLRNSVQDPNGVQTSWTYDDFGRTASETRPDGKTVHSLSSPNGWDTPLAKYIHSISERTADGAIELQRLVEARDRFDRVYYSTHTQPAGESYAWSTQRLSFDAVGREERRYTPWLFGDNPEGCWKNEYDLISRVTAQRLYNGCAGSPVRSQTYAHNGLATTTTNFRLYPTIQYQSAWGDMARVTDAASGSINYTYDGFGQLTKIFDANNTEITSIGYNVRGMKTSTTDVDSGSWTFTPNALGEVASQTNANNQATRFQYDLLGRMTKRDDPDGGTDWDTEWTWDNDAGNSRIGYLMKATSPGYAEQYWYDNKSRVSQHKISIEGLDHYINFAYQSNTGFLDTLEYPASTSGYRFKLKYDYRYGELVKISRNDSPSTAYWKLNRMDARQNSLDVSLGNTTRVLNSFDPLTGTLETRTAGLGGGASIQNLEYDWDANGNLSRRKDAGRNLTEIFTYDALDRMTDSTLNGSANLSVGYNLIGNITSKSDVGSYTYHPTKRHAAITAGSNSYGYDANGNMNSRNGSSISWYSYDLPATINGGGYSSLFSYGPSRARFKQSASYSGGSETTYYIGGILEKMVTPTRTHFRHHIASPDGLVASYVRRDDATEDVSYFTHDHLGSVDSINNGTGITYLSYDAFGKRRNASTWSGAPPSGDMTGVAYASRRGYTEHEMLDNLGLIHMNGRVQDPHLGRFLSADPYIVGLGNSQALNRYSYVNNNPLSFTDPSGFAPQDDDDRWYPPTYTPNFDWIFNPVWSPRPTFVGPHGALNRISPEVTNVNDEVNTYNNQVKVTIVVGEPRINAAGAGVATRGVLAACLRNQGTAAVCAGGALTAAGVVLAMNGTAGRALMSESRTKERVYSYAPDAVLARARREGSTTFFHGTDSVTTLAVAAGAPLSAAAAAEATRGEQSLGFYMTPDPAHANYFAARTGDPGILQINMSPLAVEQLIAAGGTIGPMQPGGIREPVTEFFLPPTAFGTFNSLRATGEITVIPHLPPK